MNTDQCPDCGGLVNGGRAGCQALWDEISARSYSQANYASKYDLAFDTYCMQHLEKYCRSAKSYAAHLTRLCCGLEHNGDPKVYSAIRQWLDGNVEIEKPKILSYLGEITVADLYSSQNAEEHNQMVQEWATDVWGAYREQHQIAHHWIKIALDAQNKSAAKQKVKLR